MIVRVQVHKVTTAGPGKSISADRIVATTLTALGAVD
jgi:hypothetical protein